MSDVTTVTVDDNSDLQLFNNDDERKFKQQFVIQFLAAHAAVNYAANCSTGWQYSSHPVEDAQQLAKEAWQAWVKTIGTVKPTHNLRLCDHADGVRGHFCIGKTLDGVYYAYWNEHQKRWATAGTVYTSKTEAEAKLKELAEREQQ